MLQQFFWVYLHFSTEKKQVELKILIMAHRCQICNKNVLEKKSSIGGGGRNHWENILNFLWFDPLIVMLINGPSTNLKLKWNKNLSLKGGKGMVDGQ